jgi:uncharacterized protein YjbJ (UPF0337 family)
MLESGKMTEPKGRLEAAAGVLPDDKQLRTKGQSNHFFGKLLQAKEKLNDASDEVKDAFE